MRRVFTMKLAETVSILMSVLMEHIPAKTRAARIQKEVTAVIAMRASTLLMITVLTSMNA